LDKLDNTPKSRPNRNILKIGLLILLVPYVAGGIYLVRRELERPTLIISSGSSGGLYFQAGGELVSILNQAFDGKFKFEANPSQGSPENIRRIQNGEAQLALAQDGLDAGPKVRALARLYSSPLHIVVRKDSNLSGVRDLVRVKANNMRTRVYVGLNDSGTRAISEQVLKQYDVALSDLDIEGSDWSFDEAARALKNGNIDVGFFLVGFGSPAVNDLAKDGGFTLLNIDRADGLKASNPYLETVEIPSGTYASSLAFPKENVRTVATRELLVCNRDMPTSTAYKILEAVFTGSPDLVRKFPLLTQMAQIDPQNNFYYPLHPGAEAFYKRQSAPPLIPWQIVGVGSGYTLTIGTFLLIRLHRRRVRPLLTELDRIDAAIKGTGPNISKEDLGTHREAIREVQRKAIGLYTDGKIKADPYDSLKEYIRFCFQGLQQLISSGGIDGYASPVVVIAENKNAENRPTLQNDEPSIKDIREFRRSPTG
jgi:uncharacterized protein